MKLKTTITLTLATISLFSFNPANAAIFYSYGYFSKNNLTKPFASFITVREPTPLNKKTASYSPSSSIVNNTKIQIILHKFK